MKTVIFDLSGPFAHFRKFYTNSSSLSYLIPPRTVLVGLIAAVLGIERDTYYEIFSEEKLKIGVRLNRPVRRILQTLNYLKATSLNEWLNPKEHTQIPFELLTADKGVSYRVYVAMPEMDELLEELSTRIREHRYYYTPYLGSASFQAHLQLVDIVNAESFLSQDYFACVTPVRVDALEENGLKIMSSYSLIREKMPVDFNEERVIQNVAAYLIDEKAQALIVFTKMPAWRMLYQGLEENIMFL